MTPRCQLEGILQIRTHTDVDYQYARECIKSSMHLICIVLPLLPSTCVSMHPIRISFHPNIVLPRSHHDKIPCVFPVLLAFSLCFFY